MRGWINTTLAQRNAVIAFTGAAERCSARLVLMASGSTPVSMHNTHTHTHRITSILKDFIIQEDIFWFCPCNIQKQMKENVMASI